MKIKVQVDPEGDSSYSISWKDTLGQAQGYKLNNRPFEIWCVLKDNRDTVGYYKGLSSPQNFIYFSTKDTTILATFMIAPNYFSDILSDEKRKKILEGKERTTEFESIRLNIKKDLRRNLEFILTEE